MTTLVASNLTDLKIDLSINDVWNDIRILLPSYSYTLELQGATWVRIPDDYSQRYADGDSINKYGRRTKILNKHVIDKSFGEEYCYQEAKRRKDPSNRINAKIMGKDDTDTAMCLLLATKMSAQVSYIHAASGLNDTGFIEKLELDISLDRIPRLNMTISEVKEWDLLDWFVIGTDTVDGVNVIG